MNSHEKHDIKNKILHTSSTSQGKWLKCIVFQRQKNIYPSDAKTFDLSTFEFEMQKRYALNEKDKTKPTPLWGSVNFKRHLMFDAHAHFTYDKNKKNLKITDETEEWFEPEKLSRKWAYCRCGGKGGRKALEWVGGRCREGVGGTEKL